LTNALAYFAVMSLTEEFFFKHWKEYYRNWKSSGSCESIENVYKKNERWPEVDCN